ncbi:MAG: hypothetical protein FJ382_14750 [Verrucomicrobia bacterium]|nr:hypothetical protein [Verrucomicrobiota bacterium]
MNRSDGRIFSAAEMRSMFDAAQGELFGDDYSQPDSADSEPVFWPAADGQASPDDDFVQADAAESP